jgi:predicted DCC family thiol-disulfide oxidoreductase YuxK
MSEPRLPVLLYDGECRLCNAVVLFLLRRDRRGALHFAALQSPDGRAYLAAKGLPTEDFDSLVFVPDWRSPSSGPPLLRTDGALAAAAELGGPMGRLRYLRVVPAFIRDGIYRLVARTRTRLFGKYRPSPLPDPAWNARFLDRTETAGAGMPGAR